jgi:ABC-type polysaccharide/polyol phosphate transport system ATPase subunit
MMKKSKSSTMVNDTSSITNHVEAYSAVSEEIAYALDIVGVSKQFTRTSRVSGYSTLKSAILSLFGRSRKELRRTQHVLSDITLRIPQGASVGIIGRNGSGKSTLLKIITGIYQPDIGSVAVNGRIAALIELGAGFHPDFTGRENVMLGGIMHGLTRAEVEERFDEIVDFAELADVIDEPVRTYSSGMFMRLGFSLAVHTDPRILLVDEVLAVGDAAFVAKCKEKLASLKRMGTTLLLVSHDLDAVERWCDEVLWLEGGVVRDRGEPRRVIDHYRQFLDRREEQERFDRQDDNSAEDELHVEMPSSSDSREDEEQKSEVQGEIEASGEAVAGSARWGSREIEIVSVRLVVGDESEERRVVASDDRVTIVLHIQVHQSVLEPVFGIGINRNDGLAVFGTNTGIDRVDIAPIGEGGAVSFTLPRLGLSEGVYTIDAAVHAADGYPYDYRKGVLCFSVRSGRGEIGVISPLREWRFLPHDNEAAALASPDVYS